MGIHPQAHEDVALDIIGTQKAPGVLVIFTEVVVLQNPLRSGDWKSSKPCWKGRYLEKVYDFAQVGKEPFLYLQNEWILLFCYSWDIVKAPKKNTLRQTTRSTTAIT